MIQTFFVYHTRLRLLKTVLIFIFTLFLYSASAQTIGFKITKIEAVYNACVTFIEWYNEQK